MSTSTQAPVLNDFLTIMVPTYIQAIEHTLEACQTYTQRIKGDSSITLDQAGNIFQKEQEYHCKGNHELELGVDQALELFEFNEYVPGYKLLTQRTQDYLFAKCMMAHFPSPDASGKISSGKLSESGESQMVDPTPLQAVVNRLCQVGLIDWLRYCVMSHPDVEAVMRPIADRYQAAMKQEIARLDAIPHVEQKTEEWHAIRKNMVSASVAGYMDSKACGCNASHERSKMEEKGGLKDRRPFSWGCVPLRHGQQYEDLTGHLYDTFNRLDSKEYGILPDYRYNWLGASPDGIIMKVKEPVVKTKSELRRSARLAAADSATSNNMSGAGQEEGDGIEDDNAKSYLDRALLGRMREIKNPVSRSINDKIPPYYYWQMLQQMYVCQLPMCDFIQTLVKYPQDCEWSTYIADTMPYELVTETTSWVEYQKLLSPYILENIDWAIMNHYLVKKYKLDEIATTPLTDADTMLTATLADWFQEVTHIAPENINRRGQAKGIMWCFTREDEQGEVDFRVEFTRIDTPANNEESIYQQECALKEKHERDGGFKLSEKHYWNVEEYSVIEVEYNQGLYEGLARFCQRLGTTESDWHKDDCIISRLRHKWDIIEELRAIEDIDAKRTKFEEYYPSRNGGDDGWRADRDASVGSGGKKTSYGNPIYQRRKKSTQPRIRTAFNLD